MPDNHLAQAFATLIAEAAKHGIKDEDFAPAIEAGIRLAFPEPIEFDGPFFLKLMRIETSLRLMIKILIAAHEMPKKPGENGGASGTEEEQKPL